MDKSVIVQTVDSAAGIELQDIDLCYGAQVVFSQLNLRLMPTGISFIIGSNGVGKTQLLRLIHGLVQSDRGNVVSPPTVQQAFLQQTPILLNRSVKANLRFIRGSAVCSVQQFQQRFDNVVERFLLMPLLAKAIQQLSGGERKRVAVARLFLQQASCYLFDEPAANIDWHNNFIIESAMTELIEQNKKVIITTHDFFQIERLFRQGRDELWVIKNGRVADHLVAPTFSQLQRHF